MADFNAEDQGLAEDTNESTNDSGLSGSSKLRSLLAKSRATAHAVAGNQDIVDISDELELLDEPAPMNAPNQSGAMNAPNPSGAMNAPGQSGAMNAPNQSGAMNAPGQSGAMNAPGQSGAMNAPGQSGAMNAPGQSGAMNAPNPSGSFSGPIPAPDASGSFSGPLPNALQQSGSVPLSPTGEFGMVPDIGSQSRDNIPVQQRPRSSGRRRVRTIVATVVVGVIAFGIIAKLIVDNWVSPSRAMIWMAAGTLLPTILVGLLLSWPNRERGSIVDTLAGLIPAGAISAAAIFLAASWSQDAIRIQAVPYAPGTPATMATVLEDPSTDVALAGCERFGQRYDQTEFRTRLFSMLTLRPSLATECMQRLSDDARLAISTSLSDRWSRELLADHEEPDKDRLCATAGGLSSLSIEPAIVRGRLLQCAMNAPNVVAQQCCSDSLATTVVDPKQWAKHLRETIPYARDPYTSTGVFAMAFHQEGLTEPQKKFAEKVKFKSPSAQLASLEFACDTIGNGRADVTRHMKAALDGECPLDAANVPSNEAVWQEICFLTITEIQADPTHPPVSTMCAMTREVVTDLAIETSRRMVHLATKKDYEGSLSKQIDSGYVQLVRDLAGPESDRREMPEFVDESEVDRVRANRQYGDSDPRDREFQYAAPGDKRFREFLKAHREQESWKDRKRRLGIKPERKYDPEKDVRRK